MKLKQFFLIVLIFSLNLHAGFFSDLFNISKQEPQITQEDAIIIEEEEIITAEDYMDSVDEPTEIEVFADPSNSSQAFDENEEFIEDSEEEDPFIQAQTIFLSYLEKPEKIYLSQHVTIKIKAIVTNENINNIKTTFLNAKNIQILNKNTTWRKTSENGYEISYRIKVFSTAARLPDFKIYAGKQSQLLPAYEPKIVALREDREFCLVLSKDFTLKSHHEKKYDEKSNIIVLELNATDANLEDFHIPYALRDGIDEIKRKGATQSIYYFAIISNDIKIFKFKYFDLLSNKYNIISFPIVLEDTGISTQTDLNPQKSKLALYKALALIALAFILFLFYFKSRKLYLLILAFIVLVVVIYMQVPISKIVLQKDIELRILPTKNSTVFYLTKEVTKADMLLKKDGYIKVLLPNKKIGWIDENFAKN